MELRAWFERRSKFTVARVDTRGVSLSSFVLMWFSHSANLKKRELVHPTRTVLVSWDAKFLKNSRSRGPSACRLLFLSLLFIRFGKPAKIELSWRADRPVP